jgi:hypothetical protein
MILRMWHGWTTRENADAYEALLNLNTEIFEGIRNRRIEGLLKMQMSRTDREHEVEFMTFMIFESLDAVRVFVGEDYQRAVVPEGARKLLSRFDETSEHLKMIPSPSEYD